MNYYKPFLLLAALSVGSVYAQENPALTPVKSLAATSIKNQQQTGTCWCFSTTSLIESECIRQGGKPIDLSEMFTVRNTYLEKAKNYILRQGHAQFSEGGLGHDVINAMSRYGAVPQEAFPGLPNGVTVYDHQKLEPMLKAYLDQVLKKIPVDINWKAGYIAKLDSAFGKVPETFTYEGKTYTPQSYAKEVVKFNAKDYIGLTSFTHQPFYSPFIVQVPDNFSNGSYYNLPLDEFVDATKTAVKKGYTIMWDTDVSNRGWKSNKGYAMELTDKTVKDIKPELQEIAYTPALRQELYEEMVTQDDHLMHITGMSTSKAGKTFFLVKNSWGEKGSPFNGYVYVSEPYYAINTITIIVPKAALDSKLKKKLGI